MSEPNSPRAGNAWRGIAHGVALILLKLALFCGWLLTKIGLPTFRAGDDLETWARGKLEALGR